MIIKFTLRRMVVAWRWKNNLVFSAPDGPVPIQYTVYNSACWNFFCGNNSEENPSDPSPTILLSQHPIPLPPPFPPPCTLPLSPPPNCTLLNNRPKRILTVLKEVTKSSTLNAELTGLTAPGNTVHQSDSSCSSWTKYIQQQLQQLEQIFNNSRSSWKKYIQQQLQQLDQIFNNSCISWTDSAR